MEFVLTTHELWNPSRVPIDRVEFGNQKKTSVNFNFWRLVKPITTSETPYFACKSMAQSYGKLHIFKIYYLSWRYTLYENGLDFQPVMADFKRSASLYSSLRSRMALKQALRDMKKVARSREKFWSIKKSKYLKIIYFSKNFLAPQYGMNIGIGKRAVPQCCKYICDYC